jgi:hypothetical protein
MVADSVAVQVRAIVDKHPARAAEVSR